MNNSAQEENNYYSIHARSKQERTRRMKERKDWHKSKGYNNSKDRGLVNKDSDMRDNSLIG